MKPIQAYPSMRAAVHELGTDGFVAAVLRSQGSSPRESERPSAILHVALCAPEVARTPSA